MFYGRGVLIVVLFICSVVPSGIARPRTYDICSLFRTSYRLSVYGNRPMLPAELFGYRFGQLRESVCLLTAQYLAHFSSRLSVPRELKCHAVQV